MLLHLLKSLSKIFTSLVVLTSLSYGADTIYTSITPLYSLVYGVSENCTQVKPIIAETISAHDFAVKPKKIKEIIAEAKLIIYLSNDYELFIPNLRHILRNNNSATEFIEIATIENITLYNSQSTDQSRHNHQHDHESNHQHSHESDHQHSDGSDHQHSHESDHQHVHTPSSEAIDDEHNHSHEAADEYFDPHFLLSPGNAAVMVKYLAKKLSSSYPHCKAQFEANSTKILARLTAFETLTRSKIANMDHQNKNFLVLHDGYQYFYRYFNLPTAVAINSNHSHHFSVKRLAELTQAAKEGKFACIIAEETESAKSLRSLKNYFKLPVIKVDTECGYNMMLKATNPSLIYFDMLESLRDNIIACYK